jgi:membrane fusion protein (multidrug efflux system)
VAGLVLAILLGCPQGKVGSEADAGAGAAPPDAADPIVEVETAHIRRGSVIQRISAPGSIVARRESRIGPEVGGRIERIFVQEGDRVETGDPLFQIEREPYELALRQAEARLDRARAEREQLETDLKRARSLKRENIVAQQRMDQLETQLAVARAAEREAREQQALARRNLDQTRVRAPYPASVAARLEDEGTTALVQPQTIVIVLQETTELEAQATLPETHFAAIQPGDAAVLHVDGLALPIATEVSSVSDVIDPATRTFLVRMPVPNPEHQLKAGTFARVEILPRAKDDVIVVPREALRREDGRIHVLLLRDGRTQEAPVRLGTVAEDVAEVLHGLRVDDVVVVGDQARTLGPGMRVRESQ